MYIRIFYYICIHIYYWYNLASWHIRAKVNSAQQRGEGSATIAQSARRYLVKAAGDKLREIVPLTPAFTPRVSRQTIYPRTISWIASVGATTRPTTHGQKRRYMEEEGSTVSWGGDRSSVPIVRFELQQTIAPTIAETIVQGGCRDGPSVREQRAVVRARTTDRRKGRLLQEASLRQIRELRKSVQERPAVPLRMR